MKNGYRFAGEGPLGWPRGAAEDAAISFVHVGHVNAASVDHQIDIHAAANQCVVQRQAANKRQAPVALAAARNGRSGPLASSIDTDARVRRPPRGVRFSLRTVDSRARRVR